MAKRRSKKPVEKVGNYEFTVRFGEPTPESSALWERRTGALAAWLLEQWKRKEAAEARHAGDEPDRSGSA